MRVKSATDPLELGPALDLVAGVDEPLIAITATASSSSTPSDTSNSTLDLKDDLKEAPYGIDAGLRHEAYASAVQALVAA